MPTRSMNRRSCPHPLLLFEKGARLPHMFQPVGSYPFQLGNLQRSLHVPNAREATFLARARSALLSKCLVLSKIACVCNHNIRSKQGCFLFVALFSAAAPSRGLYAQYYYAQYYYAQYYTLSLFLFAFVFIF